MIKMMFNTRLRLSVKKVHWTTEGRKERGEKSLACNGFEQTKEPRQAKKS
jgi:hypothetical protein